MNRKQITLIDYNVKFVIFLLGQKMLRSKRDREHT